MSTWIQYCIYTGFHLEKWARGGQNNTYEINGGAKGVSVIVCLLGGLGT